MKDKINVKLDTNLLGEVADTIDIIMNDINIQVTSQADKYIYYQLSNMYLELNKMISNYNKEKGE